MYTKEELAELVRKDAEAGRGPWTHHFDERNHSPSRFRFPPILDSKTGSQEAKASVNPKRKSR